MHSAKIIPSCPEMPGGSRTWQLLQILRNNPDGLTSLELIKALARYHGTVTCAIGTDLAALRDQLRKDHTLGWELPEAERVQKSNGKAVWVYCLRSRGQLTLI